MWKSCGLPAHMSFDSNSSMNIDDISDILVSIHLEKVNKKNCLYKTIKQKYIRKQAVIYVLPTAKHYSIPVLHCKKSRLHVHES